MDWYKWGHYNQGNNKFVIRRYRKIDGKTVWQTYPKSKYSSFNESEIEALLRRLNTSLEAERRAAEARYSYDHAYINVSVIEDFRTLLSTKATSREHVIKLMSALNNFTLKFFIHEAKNPDPNQWKKYEAQFGVFLMKQKLSPEYIKRIIQTANRFIKFLHDRYPEEVRLIRLEPVASRVLVSSNPTTRRKKFISEEDFKYICKSIDPRILAATKLSYYFGLRRAEALAVSDECLYQDALQLEQQVINVGVLGPLKSREQRLIPYWYIGADETYRLIQELTLLHPDTLGHLFTAEMKRLKLPYQFHDLRRTWITRSLRTHHYLDVKLAAGHSDLETTNKYIQDDRELQRKKYQVTTHQGV